MIVTGKVDDNDDGNGMRGNEVDNDGNGTTDDGATGYDNVDDCDGQRQRQRGWWRHDRRRS